MGKSTPASNNLIGRSIDRGRLKLVEVLGSGSSGVVFLGMVHRANSSSPIPYAVKCITKAEPGTTQHYLQRREISNHRKVSSHPNVLTLHRVVEEDCYIFLILDYCSGGDLFKFITEGDTFCGKDAVVKNVFLQILDAVEACHDEGIFHRDIKPENILCDIDGSRVYLGDFGLSTKSEYSVNFGAGSYSYMSPECIRTDIAEAYSARCNDIWALGIILCSMISGRNPWRYATLADECFVAFLRNPNFLRSMLPISEGANLILRHIFTRRERSRISLTHLRYMILDLDTFFMTEEEISHASEQVRNVAASYFGHDQRLPVYHETNTSYGVLLEANEGRRAEMCRKNEANREFSDIPLDPHRPSRLEINHVPRSQPTNSHNARTLSDPGPPTPNFSPQCAHPVMVSFPESPSEFSGLERKEESRTFSRGGIFRRIMDRIF